MVLRPRHRDGCLAAPQGTEPSVPCGVALIECCGDTWRGSKGSETSRSQGAFFLSIGLTSMPFNARK